MGADFWDTLYQIPQKNDEFTEKIIFSNCVINFEI